MTARPAFAVESILVSGKRRDLSLRSELIHDWNVFDGAEIPRDRRVMLDDETLRDGLQNPSVHDPSIGEKIEILHLMEALASRR